MTTVLEAIRKARSVEELLAWQPGDRPHARMFAGFEIVKREGEEGTKAREIEGIASAADFMDDGILLDPSFMPEAMKTYMAESRLIQGSHDMHIQWTIGRVLDWSLTENGLRIRSMISAAEDKIWTKIREEILRAFSIAFVVRDAVWDDLLGVVRATRYWIPEISIVSLGADPDALFESARCFQISTKEERAALRSIFIPSETPTGDEGRVPDDPPEGELRRRLVREIFAATAATISPDAGLAGLVARRAIH